MRTRRIVLLGTTALATGCAGAGATPMAPPTTPPSPAPPRAAAAATHLAPARCPELRGFRCATLRVPLHRRGARARDGRRLALAVAVQRIARPPRGDLVMLTGGPGQPGRAFGPRTLQRLGGALRGYRLVLLDQRGTGAGALRCPGLQAAVGSSDLAVPPRSAVLACARALGSRRDAFATADTVADLDALRTALGDRRWVLGGVSYGTFVAQRYALAHPDRVRGLVLDSVVPQDGVELLARVPMRATARVLRAVCRTSAARCPGDPAADLRAVLAAHPALAVGVLDAVTALSIGVPRLDRVPALLHGARAGDTAPLTALVQEVHRQEAVPADLLSQGLHAATLCADSPAPWGGPAAPSSRRTVTVPAAEQTAPFPPSTAVRQGLLLTCRWWPPVAAPPAAPPGPIRAPALLVNGDRDLSTPLEWARGQAGRMPRARLLIVPGAGHSVLLRETATRARDALRTFLAGLR